MPEVDAAPSEQTGPAPAPPVGRGRLGTLVASFLGGAGAWWLIGHLGWVLTMITGRRGWDTYRPVPQSAMLPLGETTLVTLVVGSFVGGLAVVLVAWRPGRGATRPRVVASVAGSVLAVAVTTTESLAVLRAEGLRGLEESPLAVTLVCAAVVLATAAGWGGALLALRSRLGAGAVLGLVAGVLPTWAWAVAAGVLPLAYLYERAVEFAWLSGVVLAIALVVTGARPAVRLVAWPLVVALAWFGQPVLGTAGYVMESVSRGSRDLAGLRDVLPSIRPLVVEMSALDVRPLTPWVTAVAVALLVAVLAAQPRPQPRPRPGSGDGMPAASD